MNASVPTAPIDNLISVIMPCHNAAPFVEHAVRSALDQRGVCVEIVVVDDGSTDGSPKILEKLAADHPQRMQLFHQNRSGPYPARNLALRHARGKYIAFLDADDWWRSDALELLHRGLTDSGADLAYCGWQNVGEGIQYPPHVPPAYEDEDPVVHFVRSCPWPIHAALIRREIVDRLRGFSEHRFASMDYDFWLRALALTRRIKRVPEVLAFYRWHSPGQVSAVKWRQVLDALAAQYDFIAANPALVDHISAEKLRDLTEGQVLRHAYRAFWKRDLVSAQKLFRHSFLAGRFKRADLGHVATAWLPLWLYAGLVRFMDGRY